MAQAKRKAMDVIELPEVRTRKGGGGVTFYDFHLDAEKLAELGQVIRYEDDTESGIQRGRKDRHVEAIAKAIREGVPFSDSITVNLTGKWIYDEDLGELLGEVGRNGDVAAYIELIDGQHRMLACKLLMESGDKDDLKAVRGVVFTVMAVRNADDKLRRQLFRQQDLRMGIDSALALVIRAKDGEFRNDTERNAWNMAIRINEADGPMKGRIMFEESRDSKGHKTEKPGHFNIRSLMSALKSATSNSKSSILAQYSLEEREQVVINAFSAMNHCFSRFLNPKHFLGETIGICTIIVLMSKDGEIHNRVARLSDRDSTVLEMYSVENLQKVFHVAAQKKFRWKPRSDKGRYQINPYDIAERLNNFIRRFWDSVYSDE